MQNLDYTTFRLVCSERSLKFNGQLLLQEYTSAETACSRSSGATGISNELDLYRTDKGNYVLHYQLHTQWVGCDGENQLSVGPDLGALLSDIPASRCKKWFTEAAYAAGYIDPEEV